MPHPNSNRPRLLDLFSCAGGAATGYHRAGFDVFGVDIDPQPRYPFPFHKGDAITVLEHLVRDGQIGFTLPGTACHTCGKPPHKCITGFQVWYRLSDFDAIHASPPCQRFSDLAKRNGNAHEWPDLVEPVRQLLDEAGLPYIIENVEGAPLIEPVMLCGSMFPELRVYRHRLFESNISLDTPMHPKHAELTFTHDKRKGHYGQPLDLTTMRVQVTGGGNAPVWAKREAMGGLDWMTGREVNEAIPPAYTEYLGRQVLAYIDGGEGDGMEGVESCPVDRCSDVIRGQACPNQMRTSAGSCATCGGVLQELDEEIQPGDYYTVDPTSPRRCPSCGMVPARESEGARRVAVYRALADVCRHFCVSDQHDDACIALRGSVDQRDEAEKRALADAWWLGHRDVCTDCNCREDSNPYRMGA